MEQIAVREDSGVEVKKFGGEKVPIAWGREIKSRQQDLRRSFNMTEIRFVKIGKAMT